MRQASLTSSGASLGTAIQAQTSILSGPLGCQTRIVCSPGRNEKVGKMLKCAARKPSARVLSDPPGGLVQARLGPVLGRHRPGDELQDGPLEEEPAAVTGLR